MNRTQWEFYRLTIREVSNTRPIIVGHYASLEAKDELDEKRRYLSQSLGLDYWIALRFLGELGWELASERNSLTDQNQFEVVLKRPLIPKPREKSVR